MKLKKPLAAALVLCALVSPAFAEDPLTTAELRKLAPGRYAVNVMGLVSMTVSMRPNGTISGVTKMGKRDRGFWSVQGQKLCIAWNTWMGGKRSCTALSGDNGSYQGGGLSIRRI